MKVGEWRNRSWTKRSLCLENSEQEPTFWKQSILVKHGNQVCVCVQRLQHPGLTGLCLGCHAASSHPDHWTQDLSHNTTQQPGTKSVLLTTLYFHGNHIPKAHDKLAAQRVKGLWRGWCAGERVACVPSYIGWKAEAKARRGRTATCPALLDHGLHGGDCCGVGNGGQPSSWSTSSGLVSLSVDGAWAAGPCCINLCSSGVICCVPRMVDSQVPESHRVRYRVGVVGAGHVRGGVWCLGWGTGESKEAVALQG